MKNLLNPKILFLINILPVLVLFFLCYGQFNIIKSLFKEETTMLWKNFAIALSILVLITLVYILYSIKNKKEISILYALTAMIAYISFAYCYASFSEAIIPWDIPRWMISTDLFVYVGTFLMPTIIHCLLIIVLRLTPDAEKNSPLLNFLMAVAVPILFFLASQVAIPLFRVVENFFSVHVIVIVIISATLFFLFFLLRSCYILLQKKSEKWRQYHLIWKIPLTLIFPLLGLLVNGGIVNNIIDNSGNGIFGNFNSIWFYILAIANGILLCLPAFSNKNVRFFLLFLKSVTFSYTFYFFLVFLPFLPLSVLAIIAVGTGFLMLTPVVLFIVHLKSVSTDYNYLSEHYQKVKLVIIQTAGILVLPTAILLSYYDDRNTLHETLEYVYTPDYQKEYHIDKVSLFNTLEKIQKQKDSKNEVIFGSQTPYLSSLFNWIVLDNLTLSDKKINKIQSIFSDDVQEVTNDEHFDISTDKDVVIHRFTTKSNYDKKQKAWISLVDFELENTGSGNTGEYSAYFQLPTGCFISDYYLNVGDKKEKGLLVEKKAALWVFNQIVNENKDPGILYYENKNTIGFRVFPFRSNEIRKTGIEFMHKEPVTITIDNKTIHLGDKTNNEPVKNTVSENGIYLPVAEKNTLPIIGRKPYYNFIVDISGESKAFQKNEIATINEFIRKNNIETEDAKLIFTNSCIEKVTFNKENLLKINTKKPEGGFYLERAIQNVLVDSYTKNENKYPVIVVVSDAIKQAVIEGDFSNLEITFPESSDFYNILSNGHLNRHSLVKKPKIPVLENTLLELDKKVLAYPDSKKPIAFLALDDFPSVVLKDKNNLKTVDKASKSWNSGLELEAQNIFNTINPKKANENWIANLKLSFLSHIMTPKTSYIVVENEAQKAMLLKKQKEVLAGNKSLDLDEDPQSMSEPGIFIMAILLLFTAFLRQKFNQTKSLI